MQEKIQEIKVKTEKEEQSKREMKREMEVIRQQINEAQEIQKRKGQ